MGSHQSRAKLTVAARDHHRAPAHEGVDDAYDARALATAQASDVLYAIAANTDVSRTWRRFGWVPPPELPEYHVKWAKAQEPTRLRDMK